MPIDIPKAVQISIFEVATILDSFSGLVHAFPAGLPIDKTTDINGFICKFNEPGAFFLIVMEIASED